MSKRSEWSQSQKDLTREILESIDIVAFSFDASGVNKGCTLNHLNGDYGYITLSDAVADNWRIFDYKTDELIKAYNSIDEIIEDGWKVST